MRPFSTLLLLTTVHIALAGECFAMRRVGVISQEEANESGIEIRATPAGPEAVWLELEFKPERKLADFSHVELEIREGGELAVAYAALEGKRSSSGSIVFRLMVSRRCIHKITLTLVTGPPMNQIGNELRMKDLVKIEKLR